MQKYLKAKVLFIFTLLFTIQANGQSLTWHNPLQESNYVVNGRGWNEELKSSYARLPERFKAVVPAKIWNLSGNSAGLTIRFFTNSRNLQVKYTIAKANQLPNMSRLNQEGVDLYATNKSGKTHWIGNHMQWNWGDTLSFTFRDLETKEGTYELYLPPYSTVTSLKIGSDKGAIFRFLPVTNEKSVVIYGSSIVQGASPSRPGLTWTNTLKRLTGYNIVNMGFSGSCLMEPALFDALSEIDAKCFVIDPIPNSYRLTDEEIISRLRYGILRLRSKSKAPILVSESYPQIDIAFNPHAEDRMRAANKVLFEAVKQLQKEGVSELYYQFSKEIEFVEDAMIEAKHPNDIGCVAYAKAYQRALRKILR
jgi:putative acetylhydrolase